MSDDGYHGHSAYDDYDDMLDDADPEPDLADDLAEHSAPSPVYFDEPGYDLVICHSDWEYYSDDYFDDDPAILKKQVLDGESEKRNHIKPSKINQKGKKRKHAEVEEDEKEVEHDRPALKDSIRGTIWRRPNPQVHNIYKEGVFEKVALLPDWRKLPGVITSRKRGRSKISAPEDDESWAKDMSLEDMGLQPQRTRSFEINDEQEDADSIEGDGNESRQENIEEDYDENEDEVDDEHDGMDDRSQTISMNSQMIQIPPPNQEELDDEKDIPSEVVHGRKKRRRNSELLTPSTSNDSKVAMVSQEAQSHSTRTLRRAKRKADDVEDPPPEQADSGPMAKRRTRRNLRSQNS